MNGLGLNPLVQVGSTKPVADSVLDLMQIGDVVRTSTALVDSRFKDVTSAAVVLKRHDYLEASKVFFWDGLWHYESLVGAVIPGWTTVAPVTPTIIKISPSKRYAIFLKGAATRATFWDLSTGATTAAVDTDVTGTPNFACWSPNSRYCAVAHLTSPFLTIYDLNSGSPLKVTNPGTLPTGNGLAVGWSADSRYVAIAHITSPSVSIYDMNSGSPVKITNPATLPVGNGQALGWSPDGRWMAVGHVTTPFITVYDWNSGSPVKITDPASLPAGIVSYITWSPLGDRFVAAHSTTPFMATYLINSGTPLKLNPPSTLTGAAATSAVWSPDGQFYFCCNGSVAGHKLYDMTGDPPVAKTMVGIPAIWTLTNAPIAQDWSYANRWLIASSANTASISNLDGYNHDPVTEFRIPALEGYVKVLK